jgi:nitrogen fixation protein
MADIVDIVVEKTEEVVTIDVTTNETIVNIISQNGGGGAVDSVNGQTGVVVLDADDISDSTTTNKFLTSTEKTNLINHLSNTSNPHSTTATQVDALQRDGSNANSNINIGEYDLKAGQFTLDTTPTGTASVGTTRWNDTLGSTETTLKGGSVILKNGVDLVARVVNKVTPNATLTKAAYQAVRVSGAQGQRLAVAYAQANNDNNSADTIGIVCETIATNQEGFILTVGQLEGINTTGSLQGETWSDGDVIYLSPTTAGALTNVKPTGATGHIVIIGYVEYSHAVNGKLYVKIMNGWELD